jgi:VIT1/CCC1 family predicted Fe2+/Mn2+ transporter
LAISIFDDRSALARDVEAELQMRSSLTKSTASSVLILLGSLLFFVLAVSLDTGLAGILTLVVVILIHELGHLAAMKAFGDRDV